MPQKRRLPSVFRRRLIGFQTLVLWKGLFNPPVDSPIFQRVMRAPLPRVRLIERVDRVYRAAEGFIMPLLRLAAAVLAPVLLPVACNVIGALFAYYVAAFISRERERGTYELLALTPEGEWDTAWTICLASVYRFNVLWHVNFLRVMAVLGAILLALPLFFPASGDVVVLVALVIALQFDAMQSIVVGCLCGMLGQAYQHSAANAGISGASLFAAAQVLGVYVPAALIYWVLTSVTIQNVDSQIVDSQIMAGLAACAALVVLHEIVIRGLWTVLRRRLQ